MHRALAWPFCLLLLAASVDRAVATGAGEQPAADSSLYVPMRDGVRLAVDVIFARDPVSRAPTVMQVTRYGRGSRDPAIVAAYRDGGMHQVFVDARGSGASFGSRPIEFSAAEVADLNELMDWVVHQPWSNGAIAFTGNSYSGDIAELATASGHPALRAAVIRHSEFAPYRHLSFPGGVRNELILVQWGAAVGEEDRAVPCLQSAERCRELGHLEPVAADADYVQVRAALAEHQFNFRSDRDLAAVSFIDDHAPSGETLESIGAASRAKAVASARVPVQVWASWMDAGTAASALERFTSLPSVPAEVFIAAWTHGGGQSVDPFFVREQANVLARPQQLERQVGFIKRALNAARSDRLIHYVPLGSTTWRETREWPPAGTRNRRLYLATGRALADEAPGDQGKRATAHDDSSDAGEDAYAVDFGTTMGESNRWHTQLGGDAVWYPTLSADDAKLPTYTSTPLSRDVELAGRARIKLHVRADRTDAAVFARLEDVDPNDRVTYLTEGQLRLVNRRPGPNLDGEPSYRRADALPVIPGTALEADILLLPVAAHLRAGHRLRLVIAGADAGTFARYPSDGALTLTLLRSATASSWIDVPWRPWQDAGTPRERDANGGPDTK